MSKQKLIAIGRSRYLYDSIAYLNSKGFIFNAIITEAAYDEYDIKHQDFEKLANFIGAAFFLTKVLYTDEIIQIIKENNIRVAISVNWKYTITKNFLDLFECGILNFHLGNLPDYKGNATINWTIINGEKYINANIHKMEVELDAGDIISRKSISVTSDTYIADLIAKAEEAAPLLFEEAVLKVLTDPNAYAVKGSKEGLRCYPRLPEDSQIDWMQNVEEIYRLIRASAYPYSGSFTYLNREKVIIWKAKPFQPKNKFLAMPGHVVAFDKTTGNIIVACKDGLLEIQEIEYDGKKVHPTEIIKSIRVRFKYIADV